VGKEVGGGVLYIVGRWRQRKERDGEGVGHVLGGVEKSSTGQGLQCVTVYKVHVVGLQPLRVVWAQVLVFCCIY